jgi:hypothetical protein
VYRGINIIPGRKERRNMDREDSIDGCFWQTISPQPVHNHLRIEERYLKIVS